MSYQLKPDSGSLNLSTNKRSERSPDWWGDVKITVTLPNVACSHCGCFNTVHAEVVKRLAGWGGVHGHEGSGRMSLKASDPSSTTPPQRSETSTTRASCADWGSRQSAPVRRTETPPPRSQPDMVDRAEAMTRDRADFDDDIPFVWAAALPVGLVMWITHALHGYL